MLSVKEAWSTLDPTVRHQDLYTVLNPITWICRLSGIFPLKLEGPVGRRKYSTSYGLIIYSLSLLVLIVTGLYAWTDQSNERHGRISQSVVLLISTNVEIILQIGSMLVLVTTAILSKDKYANAIDSLSLQDISLRKLGTKLDYATESKRHCVQLGIAILIVVILKTCDFVCQLQFNVRYSQKKSLTLHVRDIINYSHPMNWIAWTCPNVIRTASAFLFVDVVIVLCQRFGALNEHLRKMIEETKHSAPMTTCTSERICERIRSIAVIHGALCEAGADVNQSVGWNLISGVIYALMVLTTSMYYICQEIRYPNWSYVQIFGYVNWGIMSCFHIIYVVTCCHFAQKQASLTGKLIHKFQISGADTSLNNVIQSFSLQLHHEMIEFSGAGIFPLDATLIQSIVGAVTTYLVILIQFDTSGTERINSPGANESLI